MTADIEWVDGLPPITAPGSRHAEIIEKLKARPGKWAKVASRTTHAGGTQAFTKRGCEAAARAVGKREDGARVYDVFARWPAPAAQPAPAEQARPAVAGMRPLVPATIERSGRPRRQQGESEAAFAHRFGRWERGVPEQGKPIR